MQNKIVYEYAVLRLVPKVEREEFINIGILILSKPKRFIHFHYVLNWDRIQALFPKVEKNIIKAQLASFEKILNGDKNAGVIAQLPVQERFRWITANRSTILQTSRVHGGITEDLNAVCHELFNEYVAITQEKLVKEDL